MEAWESPLKSCGVLSKLKEIKLDFNARVSVIYSITETEIKSNIYFFYKFTLVILTLHDYIYMLKMDNSSQNLRG